MTPMKALTVTSTNVTTPAFSDENVRLTRSSTKKRKTLENSSAGGSSLKKRKTPNGSVPVQASKMPEEMVTVPKQLLADLTKNCEVLDKRCGILEAGHQSLKAHFDDKFAHSIFPLTKEMFPPPYQIPQLESIEDLPYLHSSLESIVDDFFEEEWPLEWQISDLKNDDFLLALESSRTGS